MIPETDGLWQGPLDYFVSDIKRSRLHSMGKIKGGDNWVLPHFKWHNYKKGSKKSRGQNL